MRISTNTIFDSNVATLNQQQARLLHTQQQIASGRRVLVASDDPVAAARALDITQSDAMNTQFAANRGAANHVLSLAESTLKSVTDLIHDVRTTAINGGNGTLTNNDRATLAAELSGRLQELTGLANSTDGVGNYLFAGFQSKTQPFQDTMVGMGYFGDDGQRLIQVSSGRQMAASDPGADIFMRIKNGNGTFLTQASGSNAGSGIISQGSVINPALLTGDSYSITFSVTAGVTTYGVTNTTTATAVLTAQPYVSGQAISFDGMQLDVQGTPANADTFTVAPSSNESLFKTITDMITALNTPVIAGVGTTSLSNSLNRSLNNLDNALDKVLTTRASLGLRLNEIDTLQTTGEDLGVQLKQSLSALQDVDYNQAISDLALQQTALQAAQKSFVRVQDLSLFSYL